MVDYDNLLYECTLIYDFLVIKKGTIRSVSRETGIPRSTIHQRIHSIIKRADPQSYNEITNQLLYNKIFRRKPRKYWSE